MSEIHYSVFIFRNKVGENKYLYSAFFPSFPDINISDIKSTKELEKLVFSSLEDKIFEAKQNKQNLKQEKIVYSFLRTEYVTKEILTYYNDN